MAFSGRSGPLVAASIIASLLGACGGAEQLGRAETRSSSVTETAPSTVRDATSTSAGGGVTSTASTQAARPKAEVLGSVEAELLANGADSTRVQARLDVLSMERLPGELVESRFRITNVGKGADLTPLLSFGRPGVNFDVSGAAILDLIGSRRYEAVRDSGGKCLCSAIPIVTKVAPGSSADYCARFGAPPPATKRVDFELPGFPPVRAVPMS